MTYSNYRHLLLLLILSTTPCAILAELASVDIGGVKLGMTETQAEQALLKHSNEFKIDRHKVVYQYSDGVTQFETPPLLATLQAKRSVMTSTSTVDQEEFFVVFSGAPEDLHVTAIRRVHMGIPDPTTRDGFVAALTGKYGTPTDLFKTGSSRIAWKFGGGDQDCFHVGSVSAVSPPLMDTAQHVQDFSVCAAQLTYDLMGDPVTTVAGSLVDPVQVVEADEKLQAWITGLEEAAVKKRAANAQAPKL